MEQKIIEVQVTVGSYREAKSVSENIVAEKLAACANIHEVSSFYVWKGKTQKNTEWYILFKTTDGLFAEIEGRVKQLSSYEVPGIIAVDVANISAPYKKWVLENVKIL